MYTFQNLWKRQKACGRMGMVRTVFSGFAVMDGRNMAGFPSFHVPYRRLHYMGGRRAGMSDRFP